MTQHTIMAAQGGRVVVAPSTTGDVMVLVVESAGGTIISLRLTRDALGALLFSMEQVAETMEIRQDRELESFSVTHPDNLEADHAPSR